MEISLEQRVQRLGLNTSVANICTDSLIVNNLLTVSRLLRDLRKGKHRLQVIIVGPFRLSACVPNPNLKL